MLAKKIIVLGLGAGDINQLPLGVYRKIIQAKHIFLRTKEHPVVAELESEGVQFESFDYVYQKHDKFELVYEEICERLLKEAQQQIVLYAVPGHPLVAERTVQLLFTKSEELGIELEIVGGQSFIDSIFQALRIDPIEGFQLLDGTDLKRDEINLQQHVIIGQVYDTFVASNVKLTLMERIPDEYPIYVVTAAGSSKESIQKILLYELDRVVSVNNLTSIYVPPVTNEEVLYKEFNKLRQIISELRGPNGCPWDKKQTHHTLKKYLIEESYELIEAIDSEDIDHIIEELGDVLLQVLLHAQIGEDDGYFSMDDVMEGLTCKMIRRHPHVFGDTVATDEQEVLNNWQEIKKQEKKAEESSLLDKVGTALPSLIRAYELQKEAAKVGFDWTELEPIWEKVKEELKEFEAEIMKEELTENLIKEFGDVLFSLINLARFYHIHPEEALMATNQKFTRRFQFVESRVKESNKPFQEHTLEELDTHWEQAKKVGL
jgi:tetrapyrrole methylase family protein / MazG family protein